MAITVLLAIGVVAFIIYAVFSIAATLEVRRTGIAVRQFIGRIEENLHPALAAMTGILEGIRKTTDNVVELTDSVRETAEIARSIERNVKNLYEHYLEGMGEAARANMAGLKAGVKAGMTTLFKDLGEKKEGSL
jgi:hypothetical protein